MSSCGAYIRFLFQIVLVFSSEAEYQAFLSIHVAQEDKIHKLWTQIQCELAKLAVRLPNLSILTKKNSGPDHVF